jgi:hypothetical protein
MLGEGREITYPLGNRERIIVARRVSERETMKPGARLASESNFLLTESGREPRSPSLLDKSTQVSARLSSRPLGWVRTILGTRGNAMSLANSFRRWTVRSFRTMMLLSALGVPTAIAHAQGSPSAQTPKKMYTKTAKFDLPVQMHESLRANVHEVRLYVKTATTSWKLQEAGQATLTRFTYRVPEDGEYWFSLATVDRNGKQTPEDVSQEAPSLRVVVDRQPPALVVQPWTSPEGEAALRCTVQDPNADLASLRMVARTPTGEMALEPLPGHAGAFRLRGAEAATTVRVTAADLAGNLAAHEVEAKDLPGARASAPRSAPETTSVSARPDSRPHANSAPALPLVSNVAPPNQTPSIIEGPAKTTPFESVAVTRPPVTQVAHVTPAPMALETAGAIPLPAKASAPAALEAGPRGTAPSDRQLLNTTRASVEYRIDQVGPSGVGKVEVFVTNDQGQSWQRLREYPDRRSPADVDLPGEGVFGIRLVITNGNGFGGKPPHRGDQPDCWIEVDTTSPAVQLRPIDIVAQSGQLDIKWTASDKNLSPEPVSLYFRTRPDAPWQLIARNVKNEGSYRWPFPRDLGSNFFFKVEVTDQAGNTARVESPSPTVLDMTEPRASVVSVSGSGSRVGPPTGH